MRKPEPSRRYRASPVRPQESVSSVSISAVRFSPRYSACCPTARLCRWPRPRRSAQSSVLRRGLLLSFLRDGSAGHGSTDRETRVTKLLADRALIVDVLDLADQLRRRRIDVIDDLLRFCGAEELDRQ